MNKLFETIISKFKKEVGKSKQMTAREIKLIEICYQEMVVKNCNAPAVVGRSEQLNCDHEWKCDTFDCYGFPVEKYCEKCGKKEAI